MAWIKFYDYQLDAIHKMKNGCILCGGVGSGKSCTSLGYFHALCGGKLDRFSPMTNPLDLYIITTARKRDTLEWEKELAPFGMTTKDGVGVYPKQKVIVDSWNNIKKYIGVEGAFFIFDEQRVVGNGTWVKSFLRITKTNQWILLSATPGDQWSDYIPAFIANGFYRSRSEFIREHVVYSRFTKYPKIERYINVGRLVRLRNSILVEMAFSRPTTSHHEYVSCEYDRLGYKEVGRTRWNPYKDRPIENASELCYVWRRVVNSDVSRAEAIRDIYREHRRLIIFYNFDYERDILLGLGDELAASSAEVLGEGNGSFGVAEWSGWAHQEIPETDSWIYLVQYTAGCEGWNCIKTDTIVFYSQNYSYKVMTQAAGRIDRLNTPYKDLYYYHLRSSSGIDMAITKALRDKKNFNEGKYVKWR